MKNVNDASIKYYCNACGDVFDPDVQDPRGPEFGAKSLDYPSDLPKELYRVYTDYWTDALSVFCYVVVLDCTPGLLVVSEYGKQDYDRMLCRAQGLETVAHAISLDCTILAGHNTGCDECNEMMLFIPWTEEKTNFYRLMYLMDKYAALDASEGVGLDDLLNNSPSLDYLVFLRKVDRKRAEKPSHTAASLVILEEKDVDGCGFHSIIPVHVFRTLERSDISSLKERLSAIRASGRYADCTDDVIVSLACEDIIGHAGVDWTLVDVSHYIDF